MADTTLVVDYPPLVRHRNELRDQRRLRLRRLALGAPASAVLVAFAAIWSTPLAVFVAAIAAVALFFAALPGSSSVDAGMLSGVAGEAAVLEQLKTLPDDYVIINRVRVPDEYLTNGERELDFIIAGPTGLWVVEVKNTPGHVQVCPDARYWPLARRAGCGSRPSWNAMRNPMPQAQAQVAALERWLLRRGVSASARPVVVMAHPEVALSGVDQAGIPVLVRSQVADYLRSQPTRSFGPAIPKTLAALVKR